MNVGKGLYSRYVEERIPDRDRSGDGGVGELDMCRITVEEERE